MLVVEIAVTLIVVVVAPVTMYQPTFWLEPPSMAEPEGIFNVSPTLGLTVQAPADAEMTAFEPEAVKVIVPEIPLSIPRFKPPVAKTLLKLFKLLALFSLAVKVEGAVFAEIPRTSAVPPLIAMATCEPEVSLGT